MNVAPVNPDGSASAEFEAATDRGKLLATLELTGLLVIFSAILTRFGL